MRNPGKMRAKCKKCGNVFDASNSFSTFNIGPLKQLKCPAGGKVSFMSTFVKDPITFPKEGKKQSLHGDSGLTQEQLEQKRIEESKYEKV